MAPLHHFTMLSQHNADGTSANMNGQIPQILIFLQQNVVVNISDWVM